MLHFHGATSSGVGRALGRILTLHGELPFVKVRSCRSKPSQFQRCTLATSHVPFLAMHPQFELAEEGQRTRVVAGLGEARKIIEQTRPDAIVIFSTDHFDNCNICWKSSCTISSLRIWNSRTSITFSTTGSTTGEILAGSLRRT
jgi:hypothetical protein